MSIKFKLKKGDDVIVLAGKDKGKTGNVTSVIKSRDRLIVEGVNITKRHRKATQESPGKIEEIEASIHISNVAHLDPETGKATRVKYDLKVVEKFSKTEYFGPASYRLGSLAYSNENIIEAVTFFITAKISLEKILRKWKSLYPEAQIIGHRDTGDTNKTCPNFDVKTWAKDKFT